MPIGILATEAQSGGALSTAGPVAEWTRASGRHYFVLEASGHRWFSTGRPACPDSGFDLEPDAILLPSLTADYQGAAYKVVADSPEFTKLLAVPIGNIVAKVPDDESVDKDSDSHCFVRCLYRDCGKWRSAA